MTIATTQKQAKELGLKTFDTGQPCSQGHISPRMTAGGGCRECNRIRARERYQSLDDEGKKQVLEHVKNYQQQDGVKERLKKREIDRYKETKDDPKARGEAAHRTRLSKPKVKQATPQWSNIEKMTEFYVESARLTITSGVKHSVDHIIPLTSPIVCGLHVENNLKITTLSDNSSKGNAFTDPDGEGHAACRTRKTSV